MRPTPDRLAPADEANLVLDHAGQVNVFLVVALLGPGGVVGPDGTPDLAALRRVVGERLAGIPELRRRVVPAGRRHRWQRAEPDLGHHVRQVTPVPGQAGLERLCGQLMGTPMDRGRPLWEVLVVPGVADRRVAAVLRLHHAVADGMGAIAIARRLFDPVRPAPGPRPAGRVPPAHGAGPASGPSLGPAPRRALWRTLGRAGRGLYRIARTLTAGGVGPTVLLGARGPAPAVAFLGADLEALSAATRDAGATVNDVLLAAVAAGLRAALAEAGEPVPDELPVSVPVALERRGAARNQVGVMLVRLPLGTADPERRLRRVAAQTREEKVRAREQGTLEFMRGPLGARVMDRLARRQRLVAGFVTNVPGPAGQLHLGGAPVTGTWPVPPLSGNVRVAVGALSAAGRLSCSVHVDADHVPAGALVRAMAAELARWGGENGADGDGADGDGPGPGGALSPGRAAGAGPVD